MNSLDTIKSTLSDSIISNSAFKEAFDIAKFVTDRGGRFKDVVLDPEQKHKLRRILNHFLTPSIKPQFVDDEDVTSEDADRIPDGWFATADDTVKVPFRMFDVETKNMVPTYSLGVHDQYCIVSHSWKGSEIGYGYFSSAKTFEPTKDSETNGQEANDGEDHVTNDLSNVINKCKSDIKALEKKLESALSNVRVGVNEKRPEDIQTLLEWYNRVNDVEKEFANSQKGLHDATENVTSSRRQAEYYQNLRQEVHDLTIDKAKTESQQSSQEETSEMKEVDLAIRSLTTEASDKREKANTRFRNASTKREGAAAMIKFFDSNRELSYGIENLLSLLQHLRSSRKIEKSIAQAKKLFDAYFSTGGKRYVWLDTCCINKADSYELTESLSLMGDWYANADFCLVHVDTPRSESSWIEEWKFWKDPSHVPVELNMEEFHKIGSAADEAEKTKNQVEWATRGWTLQELVLSKVTYYVNSHWEDLARPIEVIGPLYFLHPYILRYLGHPFVQRNKTVTPKRMEKLKELLSPAHLKEGMSPEQEISTMLQALHFQPPRVLKEKTADAQIGKAVLAAAGQLPGVLSNLIDKQAIPSDLESLKDDKETSLTERIVVFNYLLASLVDLTGNAIIEDRKFISKFSKVENLTKWIAGHGFLDCSASSALIAASERQTTVPTDQAYSLMGILGVRFPAFPAEGLPKALVRLFDEVLIGYNDVSVFNWSGKHRGSPLYGRSLYPSNIDAFLDPESNPKIKAQAKTSKRILELFRQQRMRQSETATKVNILLAEVLALAKELPERCSVFEQLGTMALKIEQASFDKLEACIGDLNRVIEGLRDFTPKAEDGSDKPGSFLGEVDSLSKSVRPPESEISKFQRPKFQAPKFEAPKFEVPKMSFGRWQKSAAQPTAPENPPAPENPSEPSTSTPQCPAPRDDEFAYLNKRIADVIAVIDGKPSSDTGAGTAPPLATELTTRVDVGGEDVSAQNFPPEDKRMVCPNPIVVSSGGIRGIFDIQRVVVSFINVKTLRSQIRTSISGQQIDGWCTISTGLSTTLVAFSCERDILSQQLDLADVINKHIDPGELATPKNDEGITSQLDLEKSREQIRVARMISFVQKPSLEGIAGEWVLARFSGVSGAQWFLCQLELGAGNDFYGRRIPTDAFSFEDAAPEKGLTEYWHTFMMEKKARTCDTLDMYLNRQKMWQRAGGELDKLQKVDGPQGQGKEGVQGELVTAWEIVQNLSLDKVVNLGKMTGLGIGGLGAELWANHLESRIEKSALKRVPVPLRTPVRDLDRNRKLLPAMFHAGREIHMF